LSTVVQPIPPGLLRRSGRRLTDWIPAVVVFVLVLVVWQKLVEIFDIQQFLLPKPTAIADALRDNWATLRKAGVYTFEEALRGFVIGSGAAILLALVVARFRRIGGALMPYAIAANAVPIVAFAPITNNWFGPFNPASKVAIAAVLCFFPVFVNTVRGLTSVRPEQIELMRSYAAGELAIFRRVRAPNALPFVFAGLKIATVLSMIGAIVGEYFGGSFDALGVLIQSNVSLFNFALAWAGIVVASAFGLAFYAAVAIVEHLATGWYPRGFQSD
jgi:NitT/TauT family transport system permease protein